ncbi:MAG: CHAD domain-containing protein [Oceanicaulis sp.]
MTEKLDADKSFKQMPGVILAEIDNARAALKRIESDPLYAVHEARKAIKKARSNARLIRKGDKQASKRINAAGRRAANVLEEARDADSLEQIARAAAIHCDTPQMAAVLREEAERAHQDGLRIDRERACGQARANLDDMAREVQKADLSGDPDAAMAEGLKRTFKRLKKRYETAKDDPSGETLHELRKRVKDWRYHTTALKKVWPDDVKKKRKKAKKAADLLGDHHDLTRLIARLDDRQGPHVDETIDALKARRKALEKKALKQAKKILKYEPGELEEKVKDAA